jgi:type II secretory pathway predicted ATPase ExeA
MYESYYGLSERAFRKTPDPRYLYLNEGYEEALEQLVFAVEEMELALLTGEVGAGKTLLTRTLLDRVGDRYEAAMVLNPRLSPRQFLATVAKELGVAEPRFHAHALLDQIHERLLALDEAGRAALLIVDEAHLIPGKATFEEIRLLTNFQLDDRNLIAVVLSGQSELTERLRHRSYRALTQRIAAHIRLAPLTAADTAAYVRHRLEVAGARRPVFDEEALGALHRASAGVPRVINHLCTQALIEGMARGAELVDGAVVAAACEGQVFLEPAGVPRAEAAPAPRQSGRAAASRAAKTART